MPLNDHEITNTTGARVHGMAVQSDIARFRAGGRAPRWLFFAVRPVAMRVRLFRGLEKIARSRRKQQPGCEESRDLLRQKPIPPGQRVRLLSLHFGQKGPRK